VIDPASGRLIEQIAEILPLGADWVFVANEAYVPESYDYLQQAFAVARVQGTVVMNRIYGTEMYMRIEPLTAWRKELTLRHFGNFWGEEPARGGRARGDYAVAIEALAKGVVNHRAYRPDVVSFDDLRTEAQVDELFRGIPHSAHKTVLRIWGDSCA